MLPVLSQLLFPIHVPSAMNCSYAMSYLLVNCSFLFILYYGISVCEMCTLPGCSDTSSTLLTACPAGFTKLTCNTNCTTNCEGTSCVSADGSVECLEGCKDGYSGRACNIPCFHKCVKCKRDKREDCIQCADGLYGTRCDIICSSECGQEGCYATELCKKDCLSDDLCGNSCLPNCELCNDTGICEGCISGYYGNRCEESCRNCGDDACDRVTGKCFECKKGFYGVDCGSSCVSCPSGVCKRLDGNCTKSPPDGNSTLGEKDTIHATTRLSPESISLIVFGILSVIIISIVSYKLCQRLYRTLKTKDTKRKLLPNPSVKYTGNVYNEINEEDMDPSSEPSNLLQRSNSSETDVDERHRRPSLQHHPVISTRSSESDSLIIPIWFAAPEEKVQKDDVVYLSAEVHASGLLH